MKKLYPVIHAENNSQVINNTHIASEAGADGVFIINHSISHETLFRMHEMLSSMFPKDFPIGINCLDLSAWEMVNVVDETIPMFWTDNAEIDEGAKRQTSAGMIRLVSGKRSPTTKYFGGVAFKYQKPVKDLEEVTKEAWAYMDVICTSGAGTGVAAPVEKLQTMRKAIDVMNEWGKPHKVSLAIASGITADNVLDYTPFVDIFLVSTGISKDFLNLDADKTKELANKIHNI